MLCLEAPADTRPTAMAMVVGRSNCRDQSRESNISPCDVQALRFF